MTIEEAVGRLRDPDTAARSSAIEALRRMGTPEAAGALALALDDAEAEVREHAAEALAGIGAVAVEPVLRYARNREGPLDHLLIKLVGRLGAKEGLDFLLERLDERDPEVRAAIAQALGRIGAGRAAPALLELLRDLSGRVRIAAAGALGELREQSAVEALLDELRDDDPAVRTTAARALGLIGSRKATDPLAIVAAEDSSPDARRAANDALLRIGGLTLQPLLRLLTGGELTERIQAMTSLLAEGRGAVPALKELLHHGNPTVRSSVADILGAIGDAGAIDALGGALGDTAVGVRLASATALGRMKHVHAAEYLVGALADDDPKVAAAATDGLERLGEHALDPLIRALAVERSEVGLFAACAARGCAFASPSRPVSAEVRIRVTDVLGRLRHKGACERLMQGLSDSTAWVRIVSCQALGEICEPQSVPAIIERLADRDAVVRAMAAEALGKLKDYRATMALLERLADPSDLVRANALLALGRVGNPVAFPYLMSALDDAEPEVRVAAIEGLAALRADKAIPRLRLLARPWPFGREPAEVRRAARHAAQVLTALV